MAELVLLGIAKYVTKGSPASNTPDVIALEPDFEWLLTHLEKEVLVINCVN